MSRIKSKNTKLELDIRKQLYKAGIRYRLHVSHLSGTPDLYISKYKTAVFINGCFWHAHGCSLCSIPNNNHDKWLNKLIKNKNRDKAAWNELISNEYRLITIWGCSLRGVRSEKMRMIVDAILDFLNDDSLILNIDLNGAHAVSDINGVYYAE
jgi:DNA mismatch endonuclease (patch repair protein)